VLFTWRAVAACIAMDVGTTRMACVGACRDITDGGACHGLERTIRIGCSQPARVDIGGVGGCLLSPLLFPAADGRDFPRQGLMAIALR